MMPEQPTQKILDRIAKMLRLAQNDGATEGERDNALRMAHATLAKYNLDVSQVEMETGKKDSGEARTKSENKYFGRTPWARGVSSTVARMLFCKYYYQPNRHDRTNVTHCFIGRHSNAVSAGLLAEFLVKSILSEAKTRAKTHWDPHFTKEFCIGAWMQIIKRVDEILEVAMKPEPKPPGMALMTLASVYEHEAIANDKHLVTLGVKMVKAPNRKIVRGGSDAHAEGRRFGASVSLNHQLTRE